MKKVKALSYQVEIGDISESGLSKILGGTKYKNAGIFILVDENTLQHCLPKLIATHPSLKDAEVIEIESGEQHKNIEVTANIWRVLAELNATRSSLIINLGGGVITDMGGFIASTFKRGIDFINIPTTLLSQVDASIGGKTGVDLDGLKNLIGVINNPEAVYVDPDFLRTLPKNEIISGFGEIIKHGLIQDKTYWEVIKNIEYKSVADYAQLIYRSIDIKNDIVIDDPTEKNVRKLLNFGHSVGHAIETYSLESEFTSLLHGEAIAIGMICESYISYKKRLLKKDELDEIVDFILPIYPKFIMNEITYNRILEIMKNDKKNRGKEFNFTLLKGIGNGVHDKTATANEIIDSLNFYQKTIND